MAASQVRFSNSNWCFILGILGFGRQWLGFTNSFVRYSNEAVLPFYVLHQTVILSVGYLVVRWAIPDLAKFIIIALSSFLLIMVFYEFPVRRNNVMRLLFGMKMRVATRTQAPVEPTPSVLVN